jgi:chemotaxis signal transduction protein
MIVERENSYVLFPMGEKRFALPAEIVKELARPDNPQTFPHCTPLLTGVLVRRGRIVPVWDVAQLLVGPAAPPRRFYLIASRKVDSQPEWTAIPVTGECELANLDALPVEEGQPAYVSGLLIADREYVAIVNLEKLSEPEAQEQQ